jgi:hypothetical protein
MEAAIDAINIATDINRAVNRNLRLVRTRTRVGMDAPLQSCATNGWATELPATETASKPSARCLSGLLDTNARAAMSNPNLWKSVGVHPASNSC